MIKEILKKEEYYLEFTDDELKKLNLNKNDGYSLIPQEDGSIFLKPNPKVDIDLSIFSKEELVFMIQQMNENNFTFSEFIEKTLKSYLDKNEKK